VPAADPESCADKPPTQKILKEKLLVKHLLIKKLLATMWLSNMLVVDRLSAKL